MDGTGCSPGTPPDPAETTGQRPTQLWLVSWHCPSQRHRVR
jgi:hypothetical protein